MKITKIVCFAFIVCLTLNVKSQNVVKDGKIVKTIPPVTEYDRSAITMILLSYPNELHSGELQTEFPKIKVPDKFDDNTLSTQVFTMNTNRNEHRPGLINYLIEGMNINKIGNGIIGKWYNRQADGSFNMDIISERGLYNATDMDVVNASAKKIGLAALKDSGEKLLGNSYILVMDYSGIQTTEEGYNASNTSSANRISHGWKGNFNAYLFKLNINDSTSSVFYNELWINKEDNSSIKTERSAKFESTRFPISYVTTVYGPISAEQPKPGTSLAIFVQQKSSNELFKDLLDKGVERAEYLIARNIEAFQVKTTVYSLDPIASKIGKKEGVKVDNRYFIYENKVKNNGDTKAVRKAVVRATNSIIDNRTISTGKSNAVSNFYQIGGKSVSEGMLLKQKNDKGIGLFACNSVGEIGGYGVGVEYLVSPILAKFLGISPTSLKVFGEVGFDSKPYSGDDYAFMRYDLGLSKSFYFARNFQLEPQVSFGKEQYSEGDYMPGSYYLKPGVKFSSNIRYNFQISAGVNYYSFIGDVSDSNGESLTYGSSTATWADIFPDRKGISLDFGLRLQF